MEITEEKNRKQQEEAEALAKRIDKTKQLLQTCEEEITDMEAGYKTQKSTQRDILEEINTLTQKIKNVQEKRIKLARYILEHEEYENKLIEELINRKITLSPIDECIEQIEYRLEKTKKYKELVKKELNVLLASKTNIEYPEMEDGYQARTWTEPVQVAAYACDTNEEPV